MAYLNFMIIKCIIWVTDNLNLNLRKRIIYLIGIRIIYFVSIIMNKLT